MATVIMDNQTNFNGSLAGVARWFELHPIQQRLKISPFNFGSAYVRIGGFRPIGKRVRDDQGIFFLLPSSLPSIFIYFCIQDS